MSGYVHPKVLIETQWVTEQHLERCKELGEKAELTFFQYNLCIPQDRFNETQGDLDSALTLLGQRYQRGIRRHSALASKTSHS